MPKWVNAFGLILLACSCVNGQEKLPDLWPKHAKLGRLPFLAAKAQIPGTAVIRSSLNDAGTVSSAFVDSRHALLGQASAENSLGWTFFVSESEEARSVVLTYEYRLVKGGRAGDAHIFIDLPHRVVITIEMGPEGES